MRDESQKRRLGLRANAGSRRSTLGSRLAFTLVELLVAILIIGILAAAVLGVAAIAGETAREAKTRNMIARIHKLLNEHYDTYRSRRVKVRPEVIQGIDDQTTWTPTDRNRARALARLYALRELMLLEMPQTWSELLLRPLPSNPSSINNSYPYYPWYLQVPSVSTTSGRVARPELTSVYLRHFARVCNASNKTTGQANTLEQIVANEGAECLYLIVVNACGDGEARAQFPESSIGDTDGDGAPEFLDGWGRPISFLRWAPGFNSQIQLNARLLGNRPTLAGQNAEWEEAAARDHDPFDIQRAELCAFRLAPLVFSAGPDGQVGIALAKDAEFEWTGISNPNATFSNFNENFNMLSPFILESSNLYLGEVPGTPDARAAAVDNIHNHLISMKPKR